MELRSVNNRFLGLKTRLPDDLLRFEPLIEGEVRRRVQRGSVTCQVVRRRNREGALMDPARLLRERQALEGFARTHGIPGTVDLQLLMSLPASHAVDALSGDEESVVEEGLRSALTGALDSLDQMRRREGETLGMALSALVGKLEALQAKALAMTTTLAKSQFHKMRERVTRLLDGREIPEEDLAREMALIAERADVSEELTRLQSHLAQIRQCLDQGGAAGKRLDFLLQEVGREVNTVGSKSTDTALTHAVVEMKVLAEQLREQVQNIE